MDLRPGDWIATDADGTLWACDVADAAWQAVIAAGGVRPEAADAMAKIVRQGGEEPSGDANADAAIADSLFRRKRVGEDALVLGMTQCYAGWPIEEVAAFFEAFAKELAPHAYATSAPLLKALGERGLSLVVVSGSPTALVRATVRTLGLDLPVRGTSLRALGGVYTAELNEPVTWNAGKVAAIAPLLEGKPLRAAFGDSLGDRELLESAQLKILVHPRADLRSLGRGKPGWCVFVPERTIAGVEVKPPDGGWIG